MISSQELRRLAGVTGRVAINPEGEPIEVEGLPDDASVPGLIVTEVDEAVKQVESEMLVHYLNRDALWGVVGFVLDEELVSSLPDWIDSASNLIQAVTDAGHEWQVVVM